MPVNTNPTSTFQLTVLTQIFQNPFESWLYGAVVQLAYNGPEPAWSASEWSLAPIDLSSLHRDPQQSVQNEADVPNTESMNAADPKAVIHADSNVTINTVAVRGRVKCHPWKTLSNTSNWLRTWDLHNSSFWNVSINPRDLAHGYELLTEINLSPEISTTTYANPSRLTCCADDTHNKPGLASVGYWSTNAPAIPRRSEPDQGPGNFTSK